jgi:hypothetical protein
MIMRQSLTRAFKSRRPFAPQKHAENDHSRLMLAVRRLLAQPFIPVVVGAVILLIGLQLQSNRRQVPDMEREFDRPGGSLDRLIHDQFEKLNSRLERLEQNSSYQFQRHEKKFDLRFEKLNSRLERLEQNSSLQFERLDKKFDRGFAELEHKFNLRFAELEQKFQMGMSDLYDRLSGKRAITVAHGAAVLIVIRNRKNYTKVGHGCGTLVKISGGYYLASAAHVLAHYQWPDHTMNLYFSGFKEFDHQGQIWFSKSHDLALMKIVPRADLGLLAANVSKVSLAMGTKIWGLPLVPINGTSIFTERVVQSCRVVGIFNGTEMEATCGGSFGFSGSGYFDADGFLVGVHIGGGVFRHFTVAEEGSLEDAWNMAYAKCNVTQLPLPMECFEAIVSAVGIEARNPRARIVDASVLNSLIIP